MMNTISTTSIDGRLGHREDGRIVLFSFLSRADTTPLSVRSRAEGHVVGQDGEAVPDPAANGLKLAFEPDPNLNAEHWGTYWRKVHGVRFLHPDAESDKAAIARLLRYDQIHRIAAGPASSDLMPYRPPVDAGGKLFDTIIGHVPPYRRPAWDGVAYLQFASLEDLSLMLGAERVRRKILPEDQALFRDLAPVLARQHVLLDRYDGGDGIALVMTHRRSPSLSRADFQNHWLNGHGPLVLAQAATQNLVHRYIQLHNIGPVQKGEPFYHPGTADIDGVTLMAFSSMRDAERFLLSDGYATIAAAESDIMRPGASEFWTGVAFTIVA